MVHALPTKPVDALGMLTIPAATNHAFAVELYLKCLILFDTGRMVRGHRITRLFAALIASRQRQIVDVYQRQIARDANVAYLRSRGANDEEFKFDNVLARLDEAFVRIRYGFEGGIPNFIQVGGGVCAAIRSVILEAQPDWREGLPDGY
jgi:hypothetical protein